jgi:N-acetylglucosamine-6-phosphate deacetylase
MTAHRGVDRLGVAAALVDGVMVPGDVEVTDGRIAAHGLPSVGLGVAVPGFIDLQVNGFGGVDFLHAEATGYIKAGKALAATGVTAYQPTFVSAPVAETLAALVTLSHLDGAGHAPRVLPAHVEGPFLSERRAGAHDLRNLAHVSIAVADLLCATGQVGMMTLAPELDGCLRLIEHLCARGVVVSLGHSDASAPIAAAGFDAGAVAVTHVFNAMRPVSARDPGLAGAALARQEVVVMAIVDDVHLARETLAVLLAATRGRVCLVTDATAAAGVGDGEHRLGGRIVHVAGREVRLADGTLAGSVLTMDAAVRNLIGAGVSFEEAVDAATRVPARLLPVEGMGRLRVGDSADVAVLDDGLEVLRTLVGGVEVFAR